MNRNEESRIDGRELHPVPQSQTSRRRLLRLAGVGSAAVVAALLPRNGARAGHDATNVMHLGENNTAPVDATTHIETDVDNHAFTVRNANSGEVAGAFRALASGSKPALQAECDNDDTFAISGVSSGPGFGEAGQFGMGNGTGVQGLSNGGTGVEGSATSGIGVHAQSSAGLGLLAESVDGKAIHAVSQSQAPGTNAIEAAIAGPGWAVGAWGGVLAFGHMRLEDLGPGEVLGPGEGVHAQSEQPDKAAVLGESVFLQNRGFEGAPPPLGIGVMGTTGTGTGVIGKAFAGQEGFDDGVGVHGQSGSGTGVRAESQTGLALDVVGKARFSTAGNDTVLAGQNSRFVGNPAATATSHISVTLHGDPGPRQLTWVERSLAGGFTVHFAGGSPSKRPAVPFSYLIVEPGS